MRRLFTVALVLGLAAGCWPHIPGKAADYDEPVLKGLVGAMFYQEPLGDYWADDDPVGDVWFGMPDPVQQAAWWELWSDGFFGECEEARPDTPDWFDDFERFEDSDDPAIVGAGMGMELQWNEDANRWVGDIDDYFPDTELQILPFDTGEGTLAVERLVTTPRAFVLTSPDMDTSDPIEIDDDEFSFTWQPSGADYVFILIRFDNLEGGVNGVEYVACPVPDTGSFSVPSSKIDDWNSGMGAAIYIGPVNEGRGTIGFNQGGNAFDAWAAKLGYVLPG